MCKEIMYQRKSKLSVALWIYFVWTDTMVKKSVFNSIKLLDFLITRASKEATNIICTSIIDSGFYHIKHDWSFSATGALYRFSNELNTCYTELLVQQNIIYCMKMIWTLKLKWHEEHAIIIWAYQERPAKHNILQFEFDANQPCLFDVIKNIGKLKM